jgi:glycine/D-amino acid oxidase-like deaminating enzyme
MDLRSNEPYWLIKNALPQSYPSLHENLECEVLIVGAGITGALIAYQLLNEGFKNIVMIDRRDVCNGSTAASTAILQYEIDTPLHKLIEQRGLTCAVSSYKECEKAIFELKKIARQLGRRRRFEQKKSVYYTSSRKDLSFLQKEFDARKEHGFTVRWMEKDELEHLGLKALAAIESQSGAVLDAYEIANELLKNCSEKGMKIFDRTEMSKIKHQEDHIEVTTAHGATIKTQHVVHCTGYESTNTLNEKVVNLKSTYALASEAFPKLPKAFRDYIFWDTSAPYLYFRGTDDNRIVMGGADESFKNTKRRDALISRKAKYLQRKFEQNFPGIPFITDYAWAGTFGETFDGLPYMGRPDAEKNEHYILGFGGNGITFSVMGMPAIVASINNEPHPFLEYYKFGRY